MAPSFLSLYQSGELTSVIDLYEADPNALEVGNAVGYLVVAQSYYKLNRPDDAAPLFLRAALAGPSPNQSLLELAFQLLRTANDFENGIEAARNLLALDPKHIEAATYIRHYLPYIALLDEIDISNRAAFAALSVGDPFALICERPLDNVTWCVDERINAMITDPRLPPFTPEDRVARRRLPPPAGKIRIGYLSNDFSTYHATMILFRAALEAHDRSRFDIYLFCYTAENLKLIDQGFRANRDDIVEIGHLDDDAAAALIRSYELDILVDLKGHTMMSRASLVNKGVAPVQAAFLGFPGSGSGIDCDYVISDRIVTPDSSMPYYHEKFCRLPDTYQPNDNIHRALPPPMRRSDAGLPEGKVVFASFNAVRKVSPLIFSLWMRILRSVPESVLWILCQNEIARRNLRHYAGLAGVDGARLIFASSTGQEAHIARLQAASIGLDSYPYNGHTTTSDKLWAGLPVITLRGGHFASRVSESLLRAIGMEELVAETPDDYVALAVNLARAPSELQAVREKLLRNRFTLPLFDTERFTRHLEDAFTIMAERCRHGEAPDHIGVPARPVRVKPFRH